MINESYTTEDGDMLDLICYKHYGSLSFLSKLLKHNKHLASLPAGLPRGILIDLPYFQGDKSLDKEIQNNLWN